MSNELLKIELENVTVILKGKAPTDEYALFEPTIQMRLNYTNDKAKIEVFNPETKSMEPFQGHPLRPLFFENGTYQLLIITDKDENISFQHEYDSFQRAITETKLRNEKLLSGNLDFINEIGLSDLTICKDNEHFFTFTIEVFPKKLDYQQDYLALVDEVNAQIYNLAYSFLKRTYTKASLKEYKDPSFVEFYRILELHVEEYLQAIKQVERLPHHQLMTTYEKVRGDKLRKQDSYARSYLRKNPSLFVDTITGVQVGERTVLPRSGYLVKKSQTYDTHENRYVKWTMERIVSRLNTLKQTIEKRNKDFKRDTNVDALERIERWRNQINQHLYKPFWQEVGKLDRSVFSLVMQMGMGYREVFKIYTWLSQSLVLHGEFYRMSLKDVATLYEYWSFLKVGQILEQKCEAVTHDIISANRDGLYVNLSANQTATRVFKHPLTREDIELKFQYHASKNDTATVTQRPDTMLSISKVGKDYAFQYVLDAKYRLNLNGKVGPLEDDINVMHRYRDAIVAENMNIYERLTFGAYVLFPWKAEEEYRNHPLFLSINKVNIGGLPFLPNNTAFVEELLDNLLNKSGEQLQREGILPKGTVGYVKELEGNIIVIQADAIKETLKVPSSWLSEMHEITAVAFANDMGVYAISEVKFINRMEEEWHIYLHEHVDHKLPTDKYELQDYLIVPRSRIQYAKLLSELVLPTPLLRILQRFESEIAVNLNESFLTCTSEVRSFELSNTLFELVDGKIFLKGDCIELDEYEEVLFKWFAARLNNVKNT